MIQLTEMTFKCLHCFHTFATPYALKRHISEKHQYNTNKDEKKAFQSNIPYKEFSLWNEDFTINYAKVISQSIIIIAKINLIFEIK